MIIFLFFSLVQQGDFLGFSKCMCKSLIDICLFYLSNRAENLPSSGRLEYISHMVYNFPLLCHGLDWSLGALSRCDY